MKNIHLLIVDGQNDFCKPDGALSVPGADKDMERLANMIDKVGEKISQIHATLDSHHFMSVFHPAWWIDKNGNNPAPFTIISNKDVMDGVWRPFNPKLTPRMQQYTETLEKNGKFALCIWPPHCLIASEGYQVFKVLYDSMLKWERLRSRNIDYVSKGSNCYTENYGCILAEVPDAQDPTTQINTALINILMEADEIWIAGEAGSHCVKETVFQIADCFGNDTYVKKLVLITDATSPVISPFVDFPAIQKKFIEDMSKRGMRTTTTEEIIKKYQ